MVRRQQAEEQAAREEIITLQEPTVHCGLKDPTVHHSAFSRKRKGSKVTETVPKEDSAASAAVSLQGLRRKWHLQIMDAHSCLL